MKKASKNGKTVIGRLFDGIFRWRRESLYAKTQNIEVRSRNDPRDDQPDNDPRDGVQTEKGRRDPTDGFLV